MSVIHCLIPCAGNSTRFSKNSSIEKKQFFLLHNIPLFIYTLRVFLKVQRQYSKKLFIYLLYHEDDLNKISFFLKKFNICEKVILIKGGKTRFESVYRGFQFIDQNNSDQKNSKVIIHDCLRIFVNSKDIKKLIQKLKFYPCISYYEKINNSLKYISNEIKNKNFEMEANKIKNINREQVLSIQTPQGFDFHLLKKGYENFFKKKKESFLQQEETTLISLLNEPIYFLLGRIKNKKITYIKDIL